MSSLRVVIPGGSGQIGSVLSRALRERGHQVTILTRTPVASRPGETDHVHWDGQHLDSWCHALEGADAVVNLAGRTVNCRYTARHRREILDSRIRSAQTIAEAIASARRPPRVWLQASTATIYAHTCGAPHDERTGRLGGDEPDAPPSWRFSIDVARAWEAAAMGIRTSHTRLVLMRSAMVLSPDQGGIFDTLLRLVRFGLGGAAGNGRQFVSWIHDYDFIEAVLWLIEHDTFTGPVNLAAPEPLPNADFMRQLRRAWGTRLGLPAPTRLLTIGAWMVRSESELILKSRRVVPGRLVESGFRFEYPRWDQAAENLCARWRKRPSRRRASRG